MPKGMHCSYFFEAPASANKGDLLHAYASTFIGVKAYMTYSPSYSNPGTFYTFDSRNVRYTGGLYPDNMYFTIVSDASAVLVTFKFWYERV